MAVLLRYSESACKHDDTGRRRHRPAVSTLPRRIHDGAERPGKGQGPAVGRTAGLSRGQRMSVPPPLTVTLIRLVVQQQPVAPPPGPERSFDVDVQHVVARLAEGDAWWIPVPAYGSAGLPPLSAVNFSRSLATATVPGPRYLLTTTSTIRRSLAPSARWIRSHTAHRLRSKSRQRHRYRRRRRFARWHSARLAIGLLNRGAGLAEAQYRRRVEHAARAFLGGRCGVML